MSQMVTKASIDAIKANAERTKETLKLLKAELVLLTESYNALRAQQLREENAKLSAAVEVAKAKLISAEIANGVKQVSVPGAVPSVEVTSSKQTTAPVSKEPKAEKGKKEKKGKETQSQPEAPIDIGRLDLRVAKVLEVKRHPDADTLYQLSIDCGDEKPRTVCSGLVKHVALEELQNRFVMLLCNLKPVKMRGVTSEAMVMCASTGDKVEVLSPPAGCVPGDLIECDGYQRQPEVVMNPKKKVFETVAPDLHTNDQLEACYKGVALKVLGKGQVVAQTLRNVAVK